jgi:DNA processing protein
MGVREASATHAMRTLRRGTNDYPAGLEALADAPPRLHVWGGELPPVRRAVAIVGARAATPYGLRLAGVLARDLAALGVVVVSGLARGIDAAAHTGALAAGGRTIAVIASSFARVTPESHRPLAARIAAAGAVVSEVAEGGPFGRGAFVKRNRIVAGLAAATVVVEASETSGALTTAAVARSLGRALLAVPGDIDRPASRGTLELLRAGARPCADAGDVLAALGPAPPAPGDPDASLRAALRAEPASVESIAAACGLAPAETLARLLGLEWCGLAVSHPGGRWSARIAPR